MEKALLKELEQARRAGLTNGQIVIYFISHTPYSKALIKKHLGAKAFADALNMSKASAQAAHNYGAKRFARICNSCNWL